MLRTIVSSKIATFSAEDHISAWQEGRRLCTPHGLGFRASCFNDKHGVQKSSVRTMILTAQVFNQHWTLKMDLQSLLKQKADIDRAIELHRNEGRSQAISKIRELMTEHGLTAGDLVAQPGKTRQSGSNTANRKPVAVKYKDANGNQWTGRGLKPKWLSSALANGKKLEDFAV